MAPFLLALGAREFVGGPLVERAINKQERCREWDVRRQPARNQPVPDLWAPARIECRQGRHDV